MKQIDLSIIIPAYNESLRIEKTLQELYEFLKTYTQSYEVVVVDDGSTDGTASLVACLSGKFQGLNVIQFSENRGKGAAVKAGMLQTKGNLRIFMDADGSTPVHQIDLLVNTLINDPALDLVIGSRAIKSNSTSISTSWYRKFLGRMFNSVVNFYAVPNIQDTQCGFKLFTKNSAEFLFPKQTANGFSFDVELLLIAQRSGMKILEVPIDWNNVSGSKVNLLTDSIRMLRDVIRFNSIHKTVAKFDKT